MQQARPRPWSRRVRGCNLLSTPIPPAIPRYVPRSTFGSRGQPANARCPDAIKALANFDFSFQPSLDRNGAVASFVTGFTIARLIIHYELADMAQIPHLPK